MTQCHEEIAQLMHGGTPEYGDLRWDADANCWSKVKQIIGDTRVTLGPQASDQWLNAPEHLAMVLSRYRAAAALIGNAESVLEIGCGEGIGAGILARGRRYVGTDTDSAAIGIAQGRDQQFVVRDALSILRCCPQGDWDAVVALDVIEHIPTEQEAAFMANVGGTLAGHGVCVLGTPSKHAEHLASLQSRVGHVNLYTPERLRDLMARHFRVVQMLYMQDTAVHFGHPQMAHYILAVGIGPKVSA